MPHSSPKNRLLAALSRDDLKLLVPYMQRVDWKQRQVIYDIGETFQHAYFIEKGVASILTTMENGSSVEVGMIGIEGMLPMTPLLGDKASEHNVVVKLPGSALKINIDHCKAAFEQSEGIRKIMLQFLNSFLHLSTQTSACNRLHSIEQRLARWLLMSSDRFQSDMLPLTQEYIAAMLGVRRVSITEAAGELQRLGSIRYNHGQITIIDRRDLEKEACECYRIDHERFKRLIS